jgi:hypothetical protein
VSSAAAGARELATDSPDEPPVVAVVAETCARALTTAVQILSDSGVTLVSGSGFPVGLPEGAGHPSFYLVPRPPPRGAVIAAGAVLGAAESLARTGPDGDLLVPRTQLRDTLLESGFIPGA